MKPKLILALVLSVLILRPNPVRAEDRLWVDAKVNGKPVRLAFDTGATHAILFKSTAERLGLKYVIPTDIGAPPPNLVVGGKSEECEFMIWGSTFKTQLRIFDLPDYGRTEADGVLGWRTLARNIFLIDAGRNDVFALKELPEKVKSWQQFRLQQDANYLTLIISDNGNTNTVVIDTGSEGGIKLAPEKWRAWKAAHPKQRLTLTGSYMPAARVYVREEAWVENISLGSLCFTNVPISEAHATEVDSPMFSAVLGMAALKQLPIVVDGKNATAYVNYRKQPLTRHEHNRLGAAFVPVDLPKDDKLVAFVASDSPAQKAGIQNGDVLLKIGDLDVTKWQTDHFISVSKTWEQPQGTELRLTLKRGQQTNEVTVKLENILGPDKP